MADAVVRGVFTPGGADRWARVVQRHQRLDVAGSVAVEYDERRVVEFGRGGTDGISRPALFGLFGVDDINAGVAVADVMRYFMKAFLIS